MKKAHSLGPVLRVDFHRALCSGSFWVAALILVLWQRANLVLFVSNGMGWRSMSMVELLPLALSNPIFFSAAVLPIAAIPYAGSVLLDRNCGFERQAIQRVGHRDYAISRLAAVIVSAFLCAVVAGVVMLGIFVVHGTPVEPPYDYSTANHDHIALAYMHSPAMFFCVKIFLYGLAAAVGALIALNVSLIVPNSYVAMLSPVLIYFAWDNLVLNLSPERGGYLSLASNLFGQLFAHSAWRSLIYSCCLTMLLLFGLCRLFLWQMARREQS